MNCSIVGISRLLRPNCSKSECKCFYSRGGCPVEHKNDLGQWNKKISVKETSSRLTSAELSRMHEWKDNGKGLRQRIRIGYLIAQEVYEFIIPMQNEDNSKDY